ncbi:hypothetical protein ACIOZM_20735 [Pseudomonas sp. NPDC087346]|uniref:hypothetical protein n=1 Tax=Pseudomonas sp. NPDC087346 TaxID=3364438 RepID=UPI00381C6D01
MSNSTTLRARPSLYSAANKLSNVSSGVDNRTGNFQASIVLGTAVSGIQDPATFSLTLLLGTSTHITGTRQSGITPQNVFELGFNTPKIVINTETPALSKIYFSNGKADELIINDANNTITTCYHKANTLKIQRHLHATNNRTLGYTVTYKDGRIEHYNDAGLITQLYCASGAGLWFEYGEALFPLLKVRNEDSNNYIVFGSEELPGGGIDDYRFTLTEHMDGVVTTTKFDMRCRTESSPPYNRLFYISQISLPNDFERWTEFEYSKPSTFNYYVLSGLKTPYGFTQYVSHFGTPRPYSLDTNYPVVARLVEEDISTYRNARDSSEINYGYSNHVNFTGYSQGRTQVDGIDNCLRLTEDYHYSSWENHGDRSIKRTYNRFHLLTEEMVIAQPQSLGVWITTAYTYPLVAGNIDNQPANFSLWTQKSVTYAKGDERRTITELREHDIYGNLLSKTQASGIKQTHAYYPLDSTQSQGCPPSPLFIRHLKSTTITPDPSAQNKPNAKSREYAYTQVSGRTHRNPITGALTSPYMVLLSQEKLNTLVVQQHTYRTATDIPLLLGVLLSSRTVSPSVNNLTNFNWTMNNRRVCVTTEHVAQSSEQRLTASGGSTEYSPSSGRVHQEVSPFGAITQYIYDTTGRLTKKTSYAGTPQEEVETYQFTYWTTPFVDNPDISNNESLIRANVLTTRNSAGLVTHSFLSRDGLILYEGYAVPGGIDTRAKELDLSKLARAVTYTRTSPEPLIKTDTHFDFIVNPSETIRFTETTTYDYMLGQLTQTTYPNSNITYTVYDFAQTPPSIRQMSSGSDKIYRTRYDKYDKVKDVYLVRNNLPESYNVLLSVNTHDGLGRLIEAATSGEPGETHFALDEYDRITSSRCLQETLAYEYSTQVPIMDVPVSVSAASNGVQAIAAHRTFDGFGRLITQVAPGGDVSSNTVVEHYTYGSNVAEQPSAITFNAGRVDNSYDPLTGMLLSSSSTGITNTDCTYAFVFDPVTKQLKSSTSRMLSQSWCAVNYTYNAQGALTREQRTYTQPGNTLTITSSRTYSAFSTRLKGMVIFYNINSVLASLLYQYDSAGRVIRQDYQLGSFGAVTVETQYCMAATPGAGNISQVKLNVERLRDPALEMTLTIDYADSGLERERRYAINQHEVLRHREQYFDDLRLSRAETDHPLGPVERKDFVYSHDTYRLKTSTAVTPGGNRETLYGSNGFQRFSTITAPNSVTNYQYQSDRVQSITQTSNAGVALSSQRYAYNSNGNVSNINDTASLIYNTANQLTQFSRSSEPEDEYKYFYNPNGQIAQVVSQNESITYLYDDNVLTGEISVIGTMQVETFYLRANGILLGRYIKKDTIESLELFGVEPSGSVRCAYTYSNEGVELSHEHYEYTDYGERHVRPSN